MRTIILDGNSLTIQDVLDVARGEALVEIDPKALKKVSNAYEKGVRQVVMEGRLVYGVTTGCGDLLDGGIRPQDREKYIDKEGGLKEYEEALKEYQKRYIKAHNCGTGKPFSREVVRAAMLIRLNTFVKGNSGVRPQLCNRLKNMINLDVVPWVLTEGSVGASGDLVPLAMLAAALMGLEGAKAYPPDSETPICAKEALKKAGLTPTFELYPKEAMAITNGATFMAAQAVFSLEDAIKLINSASVIAAMSLVAIRGETDAFSEDLINARPHKGAIAIAKQMRQVIKGAKRLSRKAQRIQLLLSQPQPEIQVRDRIQDRYSFRCIPQVHGTALEGIWYLKEKLEIEINSSTDNPLFFEDPQTGEFIAKSGGNFHGQPLSFAIDGVKVALTTLSLMADKRAFSMLDRSQSFGLPADLAPDHTKGDTGLMIAQYASAARAAENRVLSYPSSVTSVTTSANQEDFVSMGLNGALHLMRVVENTYVTLAVELLAAYRAIQHSIPTDERPVENMVAGVRWNSEQITPISKLSQSQMKEIHDLLSDTGEHIKKIVSYIKEMDIKTDCGTSSKPFRDYKEDHYLRTEIQAMIDLIRSGTLLNLLDPEIKIYK